MRDDSVLASLAGLALLWSAASAFAQEPLYKGKTVRVIFGGSAAAATTPTRDTIARH